MSTRFASLRQQSGEFPRHSALICAYVAAAVSLAGQAQAAQTWTIDPAASTLTYQSVKKNSIVETNTIRNFSGTITPEGDVSITVDLNSIDTGIDLRNVRMRFLFFETFKYPTATITAKVDPSAFADLAAKRRMVATLPFKFDLHGVVKDLQADVVVTMISDSSVSVASRTPLAIKVDDFGLLPNVEKLQQAANVTNILPTASVSFDLVFNGGKPAEASTGAASVAPQPTGPMTTDTAKATFSDEECLNRFEVLSRTGAIYFRSGSTRLDNASRPVLDEVVSVVTKCPNLKIEVAGFTDSDGDDVTNQRLSEMRARAVADFILKAGVPAPQVTSVGYGESRPFVANDTAKNKALNRRIEFSATPLAQ
jgi:outer membrane protein OmpA-like peptidoglycan-associated protein/polyisoprenoid-binding protein YceI